KSTNPVQVAPSGLIAAFAANVPHLIHSNSDCEALEDRADGVFAALHVYVTAIIAETAQNIPGSTLERRYPDHLFQQFDALGVIRTAAEIRVHENWGVLCPSGARQRGFAQKMPTADPLSAGRIHESSWAPTRPPLYAYGERSGARRSRPITRITSSSSLGRPLSPSIGAGTRKR